MVMRLCWIWWINYNQQSKEREDNFNFYNRLQPKLHTQKICYICCFIYSRYGACMASFSKAVHELSIETKHTMSYILDVNRKALLS